MCERSSRFAKVNAGHGHTVRSLGKGCRSRRQGGSDDVWGGMRPENAKRIVAALREQGIPLWLIQRKPSIVEVKAGIFPSV